VSAPTTTPTWATDPSAQVTAPSSDKQATGWIGGEEPPAGFLNWLFTWLCQWIAWLNTQVAGTWRWSPAVPMNVSAGPLYTTMAQSSTLGGFAPAASSVARVALDVDQARQIIGYGVTASGAPATGSAGWALKYVNAADGTIVTVDAGPTVSIIVTPGVQARTLGTPHTPVAGAVYFVDISTANSGIFFYGAGVQHGTTP
jgi:hypothetical protein